MIVHGNERSPFVRKVRIVLHEKGLPHTLAMVDLATRGPDWYRKSPIGKIPVLELDGRYIPDSTVICETLEDRWPTPPMYEVDRLRCRILDEQCDAVAEFAVHAFHARARGDEPGIAQALAHADRVLATLGDAVTADWPAGFGIADAGLVAATGYLTFRHGDGWRERHVAVARHVDRWADRPSVLATPVRG